MKVTTDACLFGAWVADRIQHDPAVKNILDIGSGTGSLSLMLAQKTSATFDAIELQESDYLQSLENVSASQWKERINIIRADATQYSFTKKYDIIIANPPFYENDLKSDDVSKNIAHHDAGLSLEALIKIVTENLNPKGGFFLLLPEKRKDGFLKRIENAGLFINRLTSVHQTEKHGVFRIMAGISFKEISFTEDTIIIKNAGDYSPEFTQLLKDYYLRL